MAGVGAAIALAAVAVIALSGIGGRVVHWWSCNPTASASAPSWSPDGTRIALAKEGACGTQIYVLDLGDGRLRMLAGGRSDGWPDWSPDGTALLFHTASGLYTVPARGGPARLVRSDNADTGGVWSPDGARIAFADGQLPGPGGDYESSLSIVSASGGSTRRVLGNSCNPGTPAWSRRGAIAVACYDGVYIVNTREGSARRVASVGEGFNPEKPAWSPDGRQIAFTVDDPGGVYVVNADGSGMHLVASANGVSWGDAPTWSPDGTRIAYSVSTGSNAGLFVVPAAGGQPRRLLRF